MRIAIYKDTLANRRGSDKAVISLAEALREKLVVSRQSLVVREHKTQDTRQKRGLRDEGWAWK